MQGNLTEALGQIRIKLQVLSKFKSFQVSTAEKKVKISNLNEEAASEPCLCCITLSENHFNE